MLFARARDPEPLQIKRKGENMSCHTCALWSTIFVAWTFVRVCGTGTSLSVTHLVSA